MTQRVWAALLLAAALALLWYFVRGQVLGRGRLPRPATREGYLARVVLRPLVLFGGGGLLLLVAVGAGGALRQFPDVLAPARRDVVALVGDTLPLRDMVPALGAGVLIGAGLARWFSRGGRRGWDRAFGDASAVNPRHRGELAWGAAMAVAAGLSEELFFRLALPLLIATVLGRAWVGVAIAIALFGAAHLYQGWRGVIATSLIGAMLALVYLMTGSLATAMALHVALDLNALVLRPVLSGRVRLF